MSDKIVMVLSLFLMILSSSCFAMTFSQPTKLGEFFQTQAKGAPGFVIRGAVYNNGDYYRVYDKNNKNSYGKGIAQFGNGQKAVYLHYNAYNMSQYDPKTNHFTPAKGDILRIGDKSYKNTIPLEIGPRFMEVSLIDGQRGYVFYLVQGTYDVLGDELVLLFGRLPNGEIVKYFASDEIERKYFGSKIHLWFNKLSVKNDILSLPYGILTNVSKYTDKIDGEFRFKWDDKAQWFSIEQVIY